MDKQWQDIIYGSIRIPEEDSLYIRQVHIINISFANYTIDILYRDTDGVLHDVILMKLPLHYLKIE